MNKHTPGPWIKDYCGSVGHIKGKRENGCTPTVCRYDRMQASGSGVYGAAAVSLTDEEIEANGKLIAAAPELLDMLTRLQCAIGMYCATNCIGQQDLEEDEEGAELVAASQAADELLMKVRGE